MNITEISDKINKILPLSSAQLDWDNVGVLIDTGSSSSKILLTIDITEKVLDECISLNINHIISYHPVIFTGIKKIKKDDLVMKIIRNNINVFSPHTSWDSIMNKFVYETFNKSDDKLNDNNKKIGEILKICKNKTGLGSLRMVLGKYHTLEDTPSNMIVGVGSAFRYHNYKNSVIITGEMSHHVLLHSKMNNNTVILLEHSNSERIALDRMKDILEGVLEGCEIFISKEDEDPIKMY
ncbi:hypothetical protein P3W45_001238 [Vairimorpha bombi]|jgi:putative NIF3 family GTP cyclohydrolase 1 type 2